MTLCTCMPTVEPAAVHNDHPLYDIVHVYYYTYEQWDLSIKTTHNDIVYVHVPRVEPVYKDHP